MISRIIVGFLELNRQVQGLIIGIKYCDDCQFTPFLRVCEHHKQGRDAIMNHHAEKIMGVFKR